VFNIIHRCVQLVDLVTLTIFHTLTTMLSVEVMAFRVRDISLHYYNTHTNWWRWRWRWWRLYL